MSRSKKYYDKAKASPSNLRFEELCHLAESVGFVEAGGKGSHVLYKHPRLVHPVHGKRMNFQNDNGKAKPYQVAQLLEFIQYFILIEEG